MAAPAERAPGADAIQAAVSIFLHDDGRGLPLMYVGGAIGSQVLDVSGFAARARCQVHTHHGKTVMVCFAVAIGVPLGPTDFTMDPLLREAHVAFDQGKYHHFVDWTNDDGFEPDYSTDPGGAGALLFSEASSTGSLFGYDFGRRDHPFGFLVEAVTASATVNGVHLRISPDGLVHVRVTRPVPHDRAPGRRTSS